MADLFPGKAEVGNLAKKKMRPAKKEKDAK